MTGGGVLTRLRNVFFNRGSRFQPGRCSTHQSVTTPFASYPIASYFIEHSKFYHSRQAQLDLCTVSRPI